MPAPTPGNTLQSGSSLNTDASTSDTVVPPNALAPASVSKSTHPKAQMSQRESTMSPRACSGLM